MNFYGLTPNERDRLIEALQYAVARRSEEELARFGKDGVSAQLAAWRNILAMFTS